MKIEHSLSSLVIILLISDLAIFNCGVPHTFRGGGRRERPSVPKQCDIFVCCSGSQSVARKSSFGVGREKMLKILYNTKRAMRNFDNRMKIFVFYLIF